MNINRCKILKPLVKRSNIDVKLFVPRRFLNSDRKHFDLPKVQAPTRNYNLSTPVQVERSKIAFEDENLYKETRRELLEATTLNPKSYIDVDFFNIEQKKLFSKVWNCVGHIDQMRNIGDTITAKINNQPIMVINTNEGLKGFFNVCRHRGSKIILENGNYSVLKCPYHCWTYSLQGKLMGAPLFAKTISEEIQKKFLEEQVISDINFNKENYSLFPVHVGTWGGYIFAHIDEAPQFSLQEYLGDLPHKYGSYPFEDMVIIKEKAYEIGANWKHVMENFSEYLHLPWVHPELTKVSGVGEHKRDQGPGMYAGFKTFPMSPGGTPIDADVLPPNPGLTEDQKVTAHFVQMLPNLSLFILPHHIYSLETRAVSPAKTEETVKLLVHRDVYNAIHKDGNALYKRKVEDMFNFYDKINLEDIEAVERVQEGIQCTRYTGGRITYKFEEPIYRLQNMIIDYMVGKPRIYNETTKK